MRKGSPSFALLSLAWLSAFAVATTPRTTEQSLHMSDTSLIFNSEPATVDPGDRLPLDCGVQGKYRYCFWEKWVGQDAQTTYQVADVYDRLSKGLSKPASTKGNECGIVIDSISSEDHALWICKVFVVGKSLEQQKNVVVTVRPGTPSLGVNEEPVLVSEGETREIPCTVPAARPAAHIRWFVGTNDITGESTADVTPTDEKGTYRSTSVLRHRFSHVDDGKKLRCSVEHETLDEPEYAEVALDVRFAPYPIGPTQIYGIPMDSEYEIKYNLTANPLPEMTWVIEGQEVGVPGEVGRYLTSIRRLLDNVYMATLRINGFTKEDLKLTYRLQARNDLGDRNFDITLSSGPAPPDTLGAGTVAAIIVVVLVIIVLLFIMGVMRYRQMYCFGQKDKVKNHLKESGENLKEEHDTESRTAPPAKAKKPNVFKNLTSFVKPKKLQKKNHAEKPASGDDVEGGVASSEGGKANAGAEIVYAELNLQQPPSLREETAATKQSNSEYAEIVGTIPTDSNGRKQ